MYRSDIIVIAIRDSKIQYRSASLSINPACEAGACTDCEYTCIECTIAIIDGIAQ